MTERQGKREEIRRKGRKGSASAPHREEGKPQRDVPPNADTFAHTVDVSRKCGNLPAVEGCRLSESLLESAIFDS